MLRRLELENFLLFEKTAFEFSEGLNAVSGETGAGKSLVARALGLALGGRGGHDVIRSGCDESRIRAEFHFASPRRPEGLDGYLGDGGELLVERTIRRDGGGIGINGKPVTAQAVRRHLAPLVDFAAQNEHMRLADPAHQLELLDAYGKLEPEADTYRGLHQEAAALHKRLKAGREEKDLVKFRLERARGELAELRKLDFDPERDLELEDGIREMSHAAAIVKAAGEAMGILEAGEPPALDALSAARKILERAAGVSPRLADAVAELERAMEAVEGAIARLGDIPEDLDVDPSRIDAMIERSERLKAAGAHFDCAIAELPEAARRLELEIEDLSDWDAGEDKIRAKLAEILPKLAEAGGRLGESRRMAGAGLAEAVNRELKGLGMPEAGFEAVFEPAWRPGMPLGRILDAGPSGLDEVNFFISPNPGEAPSAVAGAVSGGEASRAVLALKAALSEVYRPDLMFLDEVDAGVGARLGRELGLKLREMAGTRQVIVITHLPQIAAYARTHLKVAKKVRDGRTLAWVDRLDREQRIVEVASMIHGSGAGKITLEQAREMLREGGSVESGTEEPI